MADTKISALSAVATPDGADEFAVNQSGTSKKETLDQITMYARAPMFCVLAADYTLTSTTSVQKLLNTTTNGALTIPTGLFWFEMMFEITGLSGTAGNGAFSFAGTATLADPRLVHAVGMDGTTLTNANNQGGAFIQGGTAFSTNTVSSATGTGVGITVRGLFACSSGGTLIPSFALVTAAAGAVKAGSIFILQRIGAASDTTRGSWS